MLMIGRRALFSAVVVFLSTATCFSAGCGEEADSGGSGGGRAGEGGPGCTCPSTAPADQTACDASCAGHDCAYEDCEGAGLVVGQCASGTWSVTTNSCGSRRCGPVGSQAQTLCSEGFVCIQQFGGAQFPEECRPHACGNGPITCGCLGSSCPGQCTQAAALYFTCNTCPSGPCP